MRHFYSQSNPTLPLRITVEEPTLRSIAPHHYTIDGFDTSNNRAARASGFIPRFRETVLIFADEDNPLQIPNGVTVDAVLAVLIDHLEGKLERSHNRYGRGRRALDLLIDARDLLDGECGTSSNIEFENIGHGRRRNAY